MVILDKPIYLTEKGRADLEAEMAYLQNNKRLETIARLQEARGGGDWMDNTEHMLIEEELAFVDARIQDISFMLDHAQLIEPGNEDNQVDVGETVIIQAEDGEMEEYTIVGVAESDPGRGFISNESPLGHALLHHKVGDDVIVKAPMGELHYRIVALA
ncbi:MAG TPA: transcription elongation factor GreA [Chloroflexota bacterium]|nr:transcription elongation factor GreA [Chloroflexota bacterium]